jgi:hypothetical protein
MRGWLLVGMFLLLFDCSSGSWGRQCWHCLAPAHVLHTE